MRGRRAIGSQTFVKAPEQLLVIDAVARRYGILPHEVLELDAWQLGLAVECYRQSDATAAQLQERINNQGGMVFPVVVLRS